MFTQPCFIRKNTPELRKKLEELGYKRNSSEWALSANFLYAYQYPMEGFDRPNWVTGDSLDLTYSDGSALKDKFIDCEANELLFLAIAALRDDSDYMQWFTNEESWELCRGIDYLMEDYIDVDLEERKEFWHKAPAPELIEHFKNTEP